MILHGYFRSSAAWRLRIALGLKGLKAEQTFHHLRKGEHRAPEYLKLNPQGLVPVLVTDDGAVLTQSLAICEYLDAVHPEPRLVPGTPLEQARIRAFVLAVACDIHPVQNLKVLQKLRALGHGEDEVQAWAREVITEGVDALEMLIADQPGPFCFGDAPTLADVFLVPQLSNARRFGVKLRHPRLLQAEAACAGLKAFADAVPEHQPDAE